jgi:RHS repeat-associated protein
MGVTKFVWDPVFDCVVSELDENNAVTAVYEHEPQMYGGLLSQQRGATTHYHHHDALGSTRFLTDSSGNVTDTYLYDAWGTTVASTGTTENPFRWIGKYGYYQDAATDLLYVRARVYCAATSRWMSKDPVLAWRNSRFNYAASSPALLLDPSGLAWKRMTENLGWYVATSEEDTFEQLVQDVNPALTADNIVCIRPLSKQKVETFFGSETGTWFVSEPEQSDWGKKRPTKCAAYDASNLLPKHEKSPNLFKGAIGTDTNGYIEAAAEFFGANRYANESELFLALKEAAEVGANPITRMQWIGHSWSHESRLGGGGQYFTLGNIISL